MATNNRLQTAAAVARCVQAFAELMDDAPDRFQEYWDERNDGGNFTDEELAQLGISSDDLGQGIVFLEHFSKLMNGEAPNTNLYRITINKFRRVAAQI